MQQKIINLERIRKALTTQLHGLRQELGPKEESLVEVREKLDEVDREYELALHAISDKEKSLSQKTMSVALLQKQVRELRSAANRKESVIHRAAVIFEDFRAAFQDATYHAEKKPIKVPIKTSGGGGGKDGATEDDSKTVSTDPYKPKKKKAEKEEDKLVQIVSESEDMREHFDRLRTLLLPYLTGGTVASSQEETTEAQLVQREQDRHMAQLHNAVALARSSAEQVTDVANHKISGHLSDNRTLVSEVNGLRQEVRGLSKYNQQLKAQLKIQELHH
jgi:dynactin complex subunit